MSDSFYKNRELWLSGTRPPEIELNDQPVHNWLLRHFDWGSTPVPLIHGQSPVSTLALRAQLDLAQVSENFSCNCSSSHSPSPPSPHTGREFQAKSIAERGQVNTLRCAPIRQVRCGASRNYHTPNQGNIEQARRLVQGMGELLRESRCGLSAAPAS